MFAKIIAIATVMASATAYPLFKQCDARWKNDQLGTSAKNICQAGCLMSSVSMVLNDCHKTVGGQSSNPHTLNHWLKSNGGYVSGNSFVWGSVGKLGLSFTGKTGDHA